MSKEFKYLDMHMELISDLHFFRHLSNKNMDNYYLFSKYQLNLQYLVIPHYVHDTSNYSLFSTHKNIYFFFKIQTKNYPKYIPKLFFYRIFTSFINISSLSNPLINTILIPTTQHHITRAINSFSKFFQSLFNLRMGPGTVYYLVRLTFIFESLLIQPS